MYRAASTRIITPDDMASARQWSTFRGEGSGNLAMAVLRHMNAAPQSLTRGGDRPCHHTSSRHLPGGAARALRGPSLWSPKTNFAGQGFGGPGRSLLDPEIVVAVRAGQGCDAITDRAARAHVAALRPLTHALPRKSENVSESGSKRHPRHL